MSTAQKSSQGSEASRVKGDGTCAAHCQSEPGCHVGDPCASLMSETPLVRVYQVTIAPGARTMIHTNKHPHVVVALTGGSLIMYDKDNNKVACKAQSTCCSSVAGQCEKFQVQGQECVCENDATCRFPSTHCVENVGTAAYSEIVIELLMPMVAGGCTGSM